ncbi:hypothetical protein JOF35_004426 [Streptomyces demainii]|uniref:Uncharacterized protein n=1 Tax=Streptomyces demainii TaxID=588122 RepID=A0ABT9KUP1_9ACTN|nr:hypothetical protein [Streptomyces demainii]
MVRARPAGRCSGRVPWRRRSADRGHAEPRATAPRPTGVPQGTPAVAGRRCREGWESDVLRPAAPTG